MDFLPSWMGIRHAVCKRKQQRECCMCSNLQLQDLFLRNWTENLQKWLRVNICVFCPFHFWHFVSLFLFLSTTGAKHQQERDCVWLWWTKTQTTDQYVFWIKTQRIRFKVMEWRMEVGRALWVGSHKELWKIVTRGQPTGGHLWSASHCLYFLRSKVVSSLSLFRVCLLKPELGKFHLE